MVILGLMITGLDLKLLCFIDLLLYLRQNTFELNQVLTSACAGQTYWNTLVNIVINISVFFFLLFPIPHCFVFSSFSDDCEIV